MRNAPFGDSGTGYLGTSLNPDDPAVIQFPQFPTFFNTTNITPSSIFPLVDVQYISLASYGASFATNNVITGDSTKLIDSSAYYVLIPQHLLALPKYHDLVKKDLAYGSEMSPAGTFLIPLPRWGSYSPP